MKRVVFIEGNNLNSKLERLNWYARVSGTTQLSFSEHLELNYINQIKAGITKDVLFQSASTFVNLIITNFNEYDTVVVYYSNNYIKQLLKNIRNDVIIEIERFYTI